MFITQQQLNSALDSHFVTNGVLNISYFNDSIQLVLDNTRHLYEEMRETHIDPAYLAFSAFAELASDILHSEYGDFLGGYYDYIGRWTDRWGGFKAVANPTITYITEERAEAQKEKEAATMKNTAIENIELNEDIERFCAECGCAIEGEGHEVDGEWYCDDCFEREFVVCANCGEIIRRDDAREYRGEYYCEDCFDDNFAMCAECGDYEPIDDMTWVESEDGYVCEYCLDRHFTRCEHCDEWVRDGYTYTVYTDGDQNDTAEWCQSCFEDYAWRCDECGEWFSDDVSDNGECLCDSCYGGGRDTGDINTWVSPRRRMPYGYKPTPCMCATKAERDAAGYDWDRKIVFFGPELEIDRREKCYKEDEWSGKIVDELTNAYCKTDCSLDKGGSYSGIEIVGHPATLAWYMEHKEDYERCFDMLKEGGWLSHDAGTCGLHVHISLHPLEQQNPFAVHNMLILYDRFWDNLAKFSRRTRSQLDHWAKKYSTARGEYEQIKNLAKGERDRYYAVNLQNAHTVEIRMFRGTLNAETFFATLQLVDVITKKCIELGSDSRRVQTITWDELVASDYAELNSYLERRGLKPGAVELPEPPESEESARELARESQQLHVGDRVRCVRNDDFHELVGHTGTVTQIDTASCNYSIGVEFDEQVDGEIYQTHNNFGVSMTNRGWFCTPNMLELVSEVDTIDLEALFA